LSYVCEGSEPAGNSHSAQQPAGDRMHLIDMKRFILGFLAVLILAPLSPMANAQVVIAVGHRQPRHHYHHHYYHHHYNR
jgi:hypothetical protein